MYRIVVCACFAACLAGSALAAQNAIGGGGSTITTKGDAGTDGSNPFDTLNKQLNGIEHKAGKRDVNAFKDALDNDMSGPKGTVAQSAAAICPICKEFMYRHSDDGFKCIPKTIDDVPIPIVEIKWRKVACPVCQAKFIGPVPGNVNNKNGVDRDTCIHSMGKACIHSNVWTCPDCGYAALVESFGMTWDGNPIDDETKEFVRKTVSPIMFTRMCKLAGIKENFIEKGDSHNMRRFSEYLQQDDLQQDQIADWIKYDNAIKIYKHQKAPSTLMARLYLDGAHSCRRELNGEIAVPVLHSATEEGLSNALRRIQHDIMSATIQIRRARNQTAMIDPNRTDIDPDVLCEAADMILKLGEMGSERIFQSRVQHPEAKQQGYTTLDLYVLCLRYAGFLDRVGRMEDADGALVKAKSFIPLDANPDGVGADKEVLDFLNKQITLLREFVDGRRKCLEFEKECLNRAMWENLLAIHQKRVRFFDPKTLLNPPEKGLLNPGETAYMIGELARRCNEPGAAPAFLGAAEAIIKEQFAELDKEEANLAPAMTSAPEVYAAGKKRAKELNTNWGLVQTWVADQTKLALDPANSGKMGGKLDAQVKAVLDDVLAAAGIEPAKFKMPEVQGNLMAALPAATPTVETSKTAKASAVDAPAVAAAQTNGSGIATRDALYKMYYDAISKYVKDKKANPPTLSALVQASYIPAENACLNEKGQLVCPETHDTLLYSKSFVFGEAQGFVLFQSKNAASSKILFANGEIRIPAQKK